MSGSKVSVNSQRQDVPRSGFVYDCLVRQLNASFWKTIAATVAAASNKIRLSGGGEIASYTQFKYGIFRFALNLPLAPETGEGKKFGLLLPSAVDVGSMYFDITDDVFSAVSYDENGVVQTTVIAWDSYEAAEHIYEIEWEKDFIIFKVDGLVVATHQTRVGSVPLPLYLVNADSNNEDLGYILIKETAQYV